MDNVSSDCAFEMAHDSSEVGRKRSLETPSERCVEKVRISHSFSGGEDVWFQVVPLDFRWSLRELMSSIASAFLLSSPWAPRSLSEFNVHSRLLLHLNPPSGSRETAGNGAFYAVKTTLETSGELHSKRVKNYTRNEWRTTLEKSGELHSKRVENYTRNEWKEYLFCFQGGEDVPNALHFFCFTRSQPPPGGYRLHGVVVPAPGEGEVVVPVRVYDERNFECSFTWFKTTLETSGEDVSVAWFTREVLGVDTPHRIIINSVKTTLETSGEDVKHTRNEWRRCKTHSKRVEKM